MKLSANPESEHYNRDMIGKCKVIWCGLDVTGQCMFADEDDGYVIVTLRDAEGRLEVLNNAVVEKKLRGAVHIIDKRK